VIGIIPISLSILMASNTVAYAFASKPTSPVRSAASPDDSPLTKGFQVGAQSADRLASAIAQKTVGRGGCLALYDYERAITRVLRSIQPPQAEEQFVQGYFLGYSERIRESLRAQRASCDVIPYESGLVPGELQGSFICAAWQYSPTWVLGEAFQMTGLYQGWSDGAPELENECFLAVERELTDCTDALSEAVRERLAFDACESARGPL
jgi:hypothetical protein